MRLGSGIRAEIERDPSANQVITALVLFLLGPLESHHRFFPPPSSMQLGLLCTYSAHIIASNDFSAGFPSFWSQI